MKTPTARFTVTVICLLVIAYFAGGYAIEQGISAKLSAGNMIDLDSVQSISIDGADFTPVMKLFASGANEMMSGVAMIIRISELAVAAAVALGAGAVMRFAVYRNMNYVDPAECKREIYLFGGICILSLMISLIVTGGCGIIFTLFVHLIPFGAFFVLFLLHLIKLSKQEPEMPEFSQMQ